MIQSRLHPAVQTAVRVGALPSRGCDIDDAAGGSVVDHVSGCFVHHHDIGSEVKSNQKIQVFIIEILDGSGLIDAGIVYQQIESSEPVCREVKEILACVFLGKIAGKRETPPAERFDIRCCFPDEVIGVYGVRTVRKGDIEPLPGKC